MNSVLSKDTAKKATAIRLTGDAESRPIDAGSFAVDLGHAGMGRDFVTWAEAGRRHHAPLAAVVEITEGN
ncbi:MULTISPECIES: hypothetical protein [Pseudonocardia]|uniref:Uncharacterized protein n=2 Tax=Pseudonocardia TaxID=1847 RepID=A0A1Y2N7W9_PSEAH|nr:MULTISPECIES: hypothetical protein [Pseudonocardia]OSY43562.1 hypothetical protein BG845_00505 [Pseudonocardia autotrophica]TDN73447.1 hypothetical protein C8E95_2544 [Pseudonocardia autotrophica]BBG04187.1 hypothetical protein Pdca_53960 [Pseudonocardia autotrophica]GEC25518.1 hypothetical protein PSA01_25470 [Pseudonocardia saturnea]